LAGLEKTFQSKRNEPYSTILNHACLFGFFVSALSNFDSLVLDDYGFEPCILLYCSHVRSTVRLLSQTVSRDIAFTSRHTVRLGTPQLLRYGAVVRSPVSVQFFNASAIHDQSDSHDELEGVVFPRRAGLLRLLAGK
jgi:hypothetical protein